MTPKHDFEALLASQQARKDATRERIAKAMQVIEQEIAEHGHYPANGGKVTLTEIASRAGIGASTLRNAHHRQTRDIAQAWLKELSGRAPTTKAKAKSASRGKLAWYEEALRKVNAEALKWRTEIAVLTAENQSLKAQFSAMGSGDGAKIIGIKSRSKGHE